MSDTGLPPGAVARRRRKRQARAAAFVRANELRIRAQAAITHLRGIGALDLPTARAVWRSVLRLTAPPPVQAPNCCGRGKECQRGYCPARCGHGLLPGNCSAPCPNAAAPVRP